MYVAILFDFPKSNLNLQFFLPRPLCPRVLRCTSQHRRARIYICAFYLRQGACCSSCMGLVCMGYVFCRYNPPGPSFRYSGTDLFDSCGKFPGRHENRTTTDPACRISSLVRASLLNPLHTRIHNLALDRLFYFTLAWMIIVQ